MLYALDTEFMEDGRTIELLSIGLVAEDGRELYLENVCANRHKANPWVREHVLPHLHPLDCPDDGHEDCPLSMPTSTDGVYAPDTWAQYGGLQGRIVRFCGQSPTFLTYYGAYDWVALCQLFGPMMDLPKDWPMYAHDLRSMLDRIGRQDVTQPDDMPHHALSDAQWIMETYKKHLVSTIL